MSDIKNGQTRNYYGKWAENVVSYILQKKSHTIICQNYKTKYGEIDLVTKFQKTIYLIEVKSTNLGGLINKNNHISPYEKWLKVQRIKLHKVFNISLRYTLDESYQDIKILFAWVRRSSINENSVLCRFYDVDN